MNSQDSSTHTIPQATTDPRQQRDKRAPRGRNSRQPRLNNRTDLAEDSSQNVVPTAPTTTITTTTTSTNQQTAATESDDIEDVCLICCEPIKEYAVGQCNHRDLCAMCTLKRRDLYKELNCCICKVSTTHILHN